jgi:hypothetical protein
VARGAHYRQRRLRERDEQREDQRGAELESWRRRFGIETGHRHAFLRAIDRRFSPAACSFIVLHGDLGGAK